MRFLLVLLSLLLPLSQLLAETALETQIHDIDYGNSMHDETLIFLTTGQVVKLLSRDAAVSDELQEIKNDKRWIQVSFNEERILTDFKVIEKESSKNQIPLSIKARPLDYTPSVLGSLSYARSYFREGKHSPTESQCFNRAQVWTYEWKQNHNFYSNKVFIFFTRKYIREHNFEWWFHVAPYIHVKIDNKVEERVMDLKYFSHPAPLQQWTDFFVSGDPVCPVVKTYSDWANYPESGDCFLMKASMYYYQPIDLEMLELFGTQKTYWMDYEVKEAYREAFGINI